MRPYDTEFFAGETEIFAGGIFAELKGKRNDTREADGKEPAWKADTKHCSLLY